MRNYRFDFSWIDAVRALEGDRERATSRREGSWTNLCAATLDEARRMSVEGWTDGVATLEAREPRLTVDEIPRTVLTHDLAGSEVDIGAYLSGAPESMLEFVTLPQPKQLIRFGVDRAAAWTVKAEQLLQVGQSVLVAVRMLIARGYPVELWACAGIGCEGSTMDLRVRVQAAGEPLNIARIAWWVAHPSSFRRAMLALIETLPDEMRDTFSAWSEGGRTGYGHAVADVAKADFPEWAPTYGANVERWLTELLGRRA